MCIWLPPSHVRLILPKPKTLKAQNIKEISDIRRHVRLWHDTHDMFDIQSHCEIRSFLKPSNYLKSRLRHQNIWFAEWQCSGSRPESSRVFHLINADEVQPADRVDTRHVGHIGDVNGNSQVASLGSLGFEIPGTLWPWDFRYLGPQVLGI